MRRLMILTAVCFALQSASAWSASYKIDPDHSSINFSVKHMGISNVKGTFKDYEGTIEFDEKALAKSSAEIKIKTASINTGVEKRDAHLKSADFFDVEKYPEMTFKSTKVTKTGKTFKLEGLLSLHGVEKPVTLKVDFGGTTKDPWGNERAAFSANGKLDRTEFGLKWNKPLEKAGSLMVGNEVTMDFEIEGVMNKPEDKKAAKN